MSNTSKTVLYIAEKPSLGRTIAQALGGGRAGKGLISGQGWVVTWCVGHLYEQAMPEDYDPAFKQWRREHLPIIPEHWQLKPKSEHRSQVALIRKLLREAQRVVHCGDPDREGQLLVDEVLQQLKWRGPTERAWLPDLTDAALRRALVQRKNNHEYQGLGAAAAGRAHADWLVGMNLSRAITLANRRAGGDALISIGRVQTPTLKLIVDRDLLIENFVPQDYFPVHADFEQNVPDQTRSSYTAIWQVPETLADDQGRCLQREQAEQVAAKILNQPGEIVSIKQQAKREHAPLPFSLNELQQAASRRLGLSAQTTLDIAQALYERHKLITYPRTDCRYLANDQHAEAAQVFAALQHNGYAEILDQAQLERKSQAFNDKKITAHTAIIPTANQRGRLSAQEAAVYDMVVRTYVAQFYPDHRYQATRIDTRCLNEHFVTRGRRIEEIGWKCLFSKADDAKPDAELTDKPLPTLQQGPVTCTSAKVLSNKTRPPPRYTEGTLIRAMAQVARWIDDPKLKKILRENQGIGTEATRAGIIETLKKRGFILAQGKSILSSDLGRQIVAQIPEQLGNPAITAWWEQQLAEVENGGVTVQSFEARAITWLKRLLQAVDTSPIKQPMRGPVANKPRRRKNP